MLLCLDIGNTHILAGVYEGQQLRVRFRYATPLIGTADQFGLFLVNMLSVNNIAASAIKGVSICSVVPSCDFTVRHAIQQYFKADYFMLKGGAKTGLNVRYKNPNEVGADRIANAIGAVKAYPKQSLIIIDMGTATTLCAVTAERDYLGGAILPGMRLGMESLRSNTAKLMEVDIETPTSFLGRTTRESIQAGLYYGQMGALKELIAGMKAEVFAGKEVTVIGTGGFAQLYREKNLFDIILPDLVLEGLFIAYDYAKLAGGES